MSWYEHNAIPVLVPYYLKYATEAQTNKKNICFIISDATSVIHLDDLQTKIDIFIPINEPFNSHVSCYTCA